MRAKISNKLLNKLRYNVGNISIIKVNVTDIKNDIYYMELELFNFFGLGCLSDLCVEICKEDEVTPKNIQIIGVDSVILN